MRRGLTAAALAFVVLAGVYLLRRPAATIPRHAAIATATPTTRTVVLPAQASPRVVPSAIRKDDAADTSRARPEPLPAAARLSHRDARRVVEHALAGKLGRTLSSEEYDRLADALVRLRAATATGQREAAAAALAELEAISGIASSELGEVLAPTDGD